MEKNQKISKTLVDTGIIYALADKKDSWHEVAKRFIAQFTGRLLLPSTAIPEICYLINAYLGRAAEIKFLSSLAAKEIAIEHFISNDLVRCVALLQKYQDLNLGFVDASIVAISERLKIDTILTTDRKHFSVIKPAHCETFRLLP